MSGDPDRDPAGELEQVRALQEDRWRDGRPVSIEQLLRDHPALASDGEALLDLIYAEVVLREQRGERPGADEYARRFPDQADAIGRQFEVHAAVGRLAEAELDRPEVRLGARAVELGLLDSAQLGDALAGYDASPDEARPASFLAYLVGEQLLGPQGADALLSSLQGDAPWVGLPTLISGVDVQLRADTDHPEVTERIRRPGERGTLGRYPIRRELGRGGMGRILLVEDQLLGRRLAAKVLHGPAAGHPQHVARFVREAKVTGQLEHPNIVPVHELGQAPDGQTYFTMKPVAGQDLHALIGVRAEAGELYGAQARHELLGVFGKVCDALAFAHSRGVIHRDLKPANVMVGAYGEVLLMDWGLARLDGDSSSGDDWASSPALARPGGAGPGDTTAPLTRAGAIVGTPSFMSPEQARGESSRVDARSDIHALGAILYQLLTGSPPYLGPDTNAVLQAVIAGPPEPPSARAPDAGIPWELEAVVKQAMAPAPVDRYPTVLALRADIDRYLAGGRLDAAEYTAGQLLGKWLRRHRVLVGASAAVALIALVLGAVSLISILAAYRQETRARQDADRARREAEAAEQAVGRSLVTVRRQLAAALVERADRADADGRLLTAQLYLAQALTQARSARVEAGRYQQRMPQVRLERILEPAAGRLSDLALSRDGRWLAVAADRAIEVWRIADGTRVHRLTPAGVAISVTLSVDGSRLAVSEFSGGGSRVRLIDTRSGAVLHQRTLAVEVHLLRFAPDDHALLIAHGGHAALWDPADLSLRRRLPDAHGDAVTDLAWSPDARRFATVSLDGSAACWDARRGVTEHVVAAQVSGGPIGLRAVSFTPDGRQIVMGGLAGGPYRWSPGGDVEVLDDDGEVVVTALACVADGGRIVIGYADNRLRIRSPGSSSAFELPGHESDLTSVAVSADGRRVISASLDGRQVRVWRLGGAAARTQWLVREAEVGGLLTQAGLLGGGARALIQQPGARPRLHALSGGDPPIELKRDDVAVAIGGPSGGVLTAAKGGRIDRWSAAGRRLWSVDAAGGDARALAIDPAGGRLACGHQGGWSVREMGSGQARAAFPGPPADTVAWTRDGRRLITTGRQQLVLWDAASGAALVRRPLPDAEAAQFLAVRPDGRQLVVGQIGRALLFSLPALSPVGALRGHTRLILGAVWSPDGRFLLTHGIDGRIVFHDARRLTRLRTVRGPATVICAGFDAAGRLLAIDAAGALRRWRPLAPSLRDAQQRSGMRVAGTEPVPLTAAAHAALRTR